MRDIFVSYSSTDREAARRIAAALEARGWSVWWDVQIPPGRQYDEVIVEALRTVRCVVVLWSTASGRSMWVKNEAADAMSRRNLIPALIESGVEIPFEFRRLQAANLAHWNGDPLDPHFEQFCQAIAVHAPLGGSPPRPVPPPAAPPPAPLPPSPSPPSPSPPSPFPPTPPAPVPPPIAKPGAAKAWMAIGGLVFGILVVAAVVAEKSGRDESEMPAPAPSPAPFVGNVPAPPTTQTGPPTAPVGFRDSALRFSGTLTLDSASNAARLQVRVVDANTGRSYGDTLLAATVLRESPTHAVVMSQLAMQGDSETPTAHVHAINLHFEMVNGQWTFIRNCMLPNRCFPAGS